MPTKEPLHDDNTGMFYCFIYHRVFNYGAWISQIEYLPNGESNIRTWSDISGALALTTLQISEIMQHTVNWPINISMQPVNNDPLTTAQKKLLNLA